MSWAHQALSENLDPTELREELLILLREKPESGKPNLKPGTRLIREWEGEAHEVTVLEKGFRWRGQKYASLSPIAREITGTRWSGPRFFGLKSSSS